MDRNNDGPAFPMLVRCFDNDEREHHYSMEGGLSARDYFAAKAMAAMIPLADSTDMEWHDFDLVAGAAYAQADAMLRIRAA